MVSTLCLLKLESESILFWSAHVAITKDWRSLCWDWVHQEATTASSSHMGYGQEMWASLVSQQSTDFDLDTIIFFPHFLENVCCPSTVSKEIRTRTSYWILGFPSWTRAAFRLSIEIRTWFKKKKKAVIQKKRKLNLLKIVVWSRTLIHILMRNVWRFHLYFVYMCSTELLVLWIIFSFTINQQTVLSVMHYWTRPGPRQRPKSPRQRLYRGRPSAKSSRKILSRQRRSLPRALYRALGKAFAEGQDGPRQRKSNRDGAVPLDGVFAEGCLQALGKEIVFAEGLHPRPSAKKWFF